MPPLVALVVTLALVVAACAAGRGELEPRYVAVHNTLAAMGLVQIGPIQQGALAEGGEVRVPFELGAECASIVVVGGAGVKDLDATLLDANDRPVAHDTTREAQALVHTCLETAGSYTLAIKMARGGGTYIATAWSGSSWQVPGASTAPAAAAQAALQAAGNCESPIPLLAGSVNGTTARGDDEHEATCVHSDSREVVYKLELRQRQRVTVELTGHFDTVLYLRKDECTESSSEVACNDDAQDQEHSRLDLVLEPATYYLFVDGYGRDTGQFRMQVNISDVPSLADVCRQARPLTASGSQSGSTTGGFDHASAGCGGGAKGSDVPYQLDLAVRSRVRLVEHSDEVSPVVHVRRACADEATEIACSDSGLQSEDASYVGILDPGAYTVFADARESGSAGAFTLQLETAPEQGGGTPAGEACGDAVPISPSDRFVTGDTFAARDDVAGKCGGAGAPDVVYRFDVARRSRVSARFDEEEGRHLLALWRACGDPSSEIGCGSRVDAVLAPGSYFLAVDGATREAMGKFKLDWLVRDAAAQEGACKNPPLLVDGRTVSGTTAGAGDKFTTSCAGREDNQGSADRMYKLILAAKSKVRLALTTPNWDGVLVLRKSCTDVGANARAAEVQCNNDFEDARHSRIEATLDAGTYYVLVDGHATGNEGAFSLEYKTLR